jgi:hypothetical protein
MNQRIEYNVRPSRTFDTVGGTGRKEEQPLHLSKDALGSNKQQGIVPHALGLQKVHELTQGVVKKVEHGLVRVAAKIWNVVKLLEVVVGDLEGKVHRTGSPVDEDGLMRG